MRSSYESSLSQPACTVARELVAAQPRGRACEGRVGDLLPSHPEAACRSATHVGCHMNTRDKGQCQL